MKYKFDTSQEQYYPFDEKPIMETTDGFEVYRGDKVYQLEGTDKVFYSEQEYIQFVLEEYTKIKEVE